MGDTAKAGFEQPDPSELSLQCVRGVPYEDLLMYSKVLLITMALSFGIDDYIEGGVITAVILLNIIVG